ncbi:DUF1345 domain-containing protein [Pseudolysinimonas sp.]
MRRTARATAPRPRPDRPRLASDVTRSWLAIAIGTPFLMLVPLTTFVAPEVVGFEGPDDLNSLTSGTFYVGWTAFCLIAVILTVATFRRATGAELRRWLDGTRAPEGRLQRFWWMLNGGGAISWAVTGSLVALLALLDVALSGREMPFLFVVAGVAVVPASIAIIIVTFAVSHARANREAALRFPGTELPVFADYLYLSIQLTATFGGSDVEIANTRMRRAVSVHALLAFAYNAFVVALLVSALLNAAG